jgi:hypothetical protein
MKAVEEYPVWVREILTMQRLSDEMFNATLFLDNYNERSGESKSMPAFMDDEGTRSFIDVVMEKEGLAREKVVTTDGKGNVWTCMTLFILFCGWLNPSIRHRVVSRSIDSFDFL